MAQPHATQIHPGRRWLAAAIWLLGAACAVVALVLILLNPAPGATVWGFRGFQAYNGFLFLTLGALIIYRRPENRIGWLFLLVGFAPCLQSLAEEYAILGLLTRPGSLPGARFSAWLTNWLWILGEFPLISHVLLVFPDGRLLSPRWRPVIWFTSLLVGAFVLLMAFASGETIAVPVANPFGLDILPEQTSLFVFLVLYGLLFTLAVLSVIALIWRYRRGTPVERQQLKWLIFSGLALPVASVVGSYPGPVADVLLAVSAAVIPAAIALAIFRYRLFDIDIIIRRTAVYTAVSAVLAAIYFGSVVLLQRLIGGLGSGDSPLAIVLSTLLIAALFAPLRRRLQAFINHRFDRSSYNAARTLARFAVAARDETDLGQLQRALLRAVHKTMRPSHLALWLPAGDRKRAASEQHQAIHPARGSDAN